MNDDKVNHRGDSWTVYEPDKNCLSGCDGQAEWWQLEMKHILHVYLLHASSIYHLVGTLCECTVQSYFYLYLSLYQSFPYCPLQAEQQTKAINFISYLNSHPMAKSYLATLVDKLSLTRAHTHTSTCNMLSLHSPHNEKIHLFLTIGRAYKLCLKVSFRLDC